MNLPVRRRSGAAVVALLTALALAACSSGSDDREPAAGQPTTRATTDSSPSEEPTDEPTEEPLEQTPNGKRGSAVPIYFVGDTSSRSPRLFREFHRVAGDPLTEAARMVAGGGDPLDPDYRTLWPQVDITSVDATDGVLLVRIPSDGFTERPDGMSRREARLALQQMVRTLQGVQQDRVPVQILREGGPARLFGLRTTAPFREASALKTLNHVNITSPAEGDTVSRNALPGKELTVTGVANSFEASGPCRLIVGGKEMAVAPYQSDGWMGDRLFAFEVKLPLTDIGPSRFVVQCETDDPSGGAEGNGPDIDTKSITVR